MQATCLAQGAQWMFTITVVVQSPSVRLFVTPWTAAHQAPLSFTISRSLLRCMFIESVMLCNCLSSVARFSFCPQSFQASGCFPMGQFFASGGQSTGVSASTSVLPMNTQDWYPLGWTGWISLQPGTPKSSLQQHSLKASILWHSAFFIAQLSHPYMTPGKTIALIRRTFVGKVSFLGGIQHSPVDGCSAASCNLWSSRRRWAHVLLLCHLAVKGIEH